jgi:hypothetical protein
MLLLRKVAMKWWNSLDVRTKWEYTEKHYGQRIPDSLTGREIQFIFQCEGE